MEKDPLEISGMHDGASAEIFRTAELLRSKMTEMEKKLWSFLKTRPSGYKFRRQHPIRCCILDFYCHALRLSIEIDGNYHLGKDQRIKDKERTNYLKQVGIRELRFCNNQVNNNFESVLGSINEYLRVGHP